MHSASALSMTTPHKQLRPVLYQDLDDTLLVHAGGHIWPAPGARDYMLWALENFEVRWLTRWCPGGCMSSSLRRDFCNLLKLPPSAARQIRGLDWRVSYSKINGIAWLEHTLQDRPFIWVEDEYGVRDDVERRFLEENGFLSSYYHCNVSEDLLSLRRLHLRLKEEYTPELVTPLGQVA